MTAPPKKAPRKPTAVEKLQPSKLKPQLELLGDDIDLTKLYLSLGGTGFNMVGAVEDVTVSRTIEGASTVTVTVSDRDRKLLRSGILSHRLTTEIDGLFFILVGVEKQGADLHLTFEDREIYVLRTYNKPIVQSQKTNRNKITRAEFILRLIKEVKEESIPYVIPELHVVQPIGKSADNADQSSKDQNRSFGIPKNSGLKVKGAAITAEQRANANKILDTGSSRLPPRRDLVMSMMCAIQESSITNLGQPLPGAYNHLSTDPTYNPVGVFQQIKHWGWPASRDVETDAAAFFDKLIPYAAANPSQDYGQVIDSVQRSGKPKAYDQWKDEAEAIVTSYGLPGGTSAQANSSWTAQNNASTEYEFYRGIPPTAQAQKKKGKGGWGRESSWDCIKRLADEVQWRAFFVSGTFYYISDEDLFKSQPMATIDEDTKGIDNIDGTYDEGKKSASLTITCEMSRWAAPPGSIIQVVNMGPWNGRWIVNTIDRSVFSRQATIVVKKPLPVLPEPKDSNLGTNATGTWTGGPTHDPSSDPSQRQQYRAVGITQPIPAGHHNNIAQGVHQTLGLAGYPAVDFGCDAYSPVIAVEKGKIVRYSGSDPNTPPPLGPGGPYGWSLYLLGDSGTEYYYTHMQTRTKPDPATGIQTHVAAGELIGTCANWIKASGGVTPNHIHLGVHPGSTGRPDVNDILNAPIAKS
jgi:hypothetical protein